MDFHLRERPTASKSFGDNATLIDVEEIDSGARDNRRLSALEDFMHWVSRVGLLAASLFAPALVHAASWEVRRTPDPLTKEIVTTASLFNPERNQRTTFRCDRRRFRAFVDFDEYLGEQLVPVRYRIDGRSLVSESWAPSARGSTLFAHKEILLARSLLRATSFVIEAVDYSGRSHHAIFSFTGAKEAVEPVLSACGLTLDGMDRHVTGLRPRIAYELEAWGPKYTLARKKMLSAAKMYNGPLDSNVEPVFALAAQNYFDAYMAGCRSGAMRGSASCDTMKSLPAAEGGSSFPEVGHVIWERAPDNLKEMYRALRRSD